MFECLRLIGIVDKEKVREKEEMKEINKLLKSKESVCVGKR